MNINDRLDRIEAKFKPRPTERLVWWIRFVSPSHLDRPVTRIRHGEKEWHRLDGEAEEAFQLRAECEAVLPPGSSGLLMPMGS
jgi:hypothetical protein